jgi:hypothetical protein
MALNECEYSRNISKAIDSCSKSCSMLRKVVEDARAANDPATVSVFTETLAIQQNAVTDLAKCRSEHQNSCAKCNSV